MCGRFVQRHGRHEVQPKIKWSEMLAPSSRRLQTSSRFALLLHACFVMNSILLADLVRDGLAMMQGETVNVDERKIEIIRVMITDAGQRAIEG